MGGRTWVNTRHPDISEFVLDDIEDVLVGVRMQLDAEFVEFCIGADITFNI